MEIKTLEKSCIGFELPDGKKFLMHEKDIEKLSNDIFIYILSTNQERVFLIKDTGLERANKLYEIYQTEKSVMTEKGKQTCLAKIIKYLTEDDYELNTLKNLIEVNKNKTQ